MSTTSEPPRQSGPLARTTRLTQTRVHALQPVSTQRDVSDPECRGLVLRIAPTGSKTWLFRYKWRGQQVRLAIGAYPGKSLADARKDAKGFRESLEKGLDPRRGRRDQRAPRPQPGDAPPDPHSVKTLIDEFLERYVQKEHKRPEYTKRILEREIPAAWLARDARTIAPREVIELLDGIVARDSKVMANRTAGVLSQMFRFGIQRAIVDDSPVKLLYRPGGKEKPRSRTLSDDELRAFLADPKGATRYERMAHVLLVLLVTGQRRGELALARREHVDLDAKTWTIPDENSKTGKGHVVPLTDWAVAEMRELRGLAAGSEWVLPSTDLKKPIDAKQLTRSVAKLQKRFKALGIQAFTLHDLRRTCRTGLARLEVAPHIAERVLNHAQERIPGTYDVHDYLAEKRAALEKWEAHLRKLVP